MVDAAISYIQRRKLVRSSEMEAEMEEYALELGRDALMTFDLERDMARFIKRAFDKRFGPTWQCVVGQQYGTFISYRSLHFISFSLAQMEFLLFKTD